MGQQQVYKILKENKNKWFSSKEIAELLNINRSTVSVSLSKLYRFDWLSRKQNNIFHGGRFYLYKYKE